MKSSYLKAVVAVACASMASLAHAGITSTWTLTNDYDFRGVTQTAKDPALQASVDYAHDSGFYAGLWFSNVKFAEEAPKGDLERDIYLGFSNKFATDFTYDVGIVDYTYNQHVFDFYEAYGSLGYKWVKAKLSYSPDYAGDLTEGNTKAYALGVDANVALPANFSLLAHVGRSWGQYWDEVGGPYIDYSAGVGYTAGKFNLALKYVDTNTTEEKGNRITDDYFNNEGRVVFTVATTFPW